MTARLAGTVVLAVVAHEVDAYCMLRDSSEAASLANEGEIISDRKRAEVEENVMIRTEA